MIKRKLKINDDNKKKKNILLSLELYNPDKKLSSEEIEKVYGEKVAEKVLNPDGAEVQGKTIDEAFASADLFPMFYRRDNGSFALPVKGMGLWNIIEGYIALQKDGKTVAGVTFYEQKETAGLGAEIQTDWFQSSFKGKSIVDQQGKIVSVTVVKGKVADTKSVRPENAVDGISGATLTCKGVNELLLRGLKTYKPYLDKAWAAQ